MTGPMDVHIAAIEYALPDRAVGLDDLAKAGRLTSPPDVLRSFGFEQAWIAGAERDQLAARAVTRLLEHAGVDAASIDVLFYAAAAATSHAAGNGTLADFSYPAARLQYDFGFANARVVGVSQAGCLGLMSAVNLARAMLVADPSVHRVLCVSADLLPEGMGREILFNLISDGACALLLERGTGPNRLIAERQITKGYYWDCDARANEIVAAYFPTARTIIHDTLEAAGQSVDGLAQVVPHNVSQRSWDILLRLTGLPPERLYSDNIASKAHVISGDNFINLKDAAAAGKIHSGDRVLLFNFGFGASWACLLLEH
jgi:3-oxoacyl-[acyl-carrier-protein] synthase-3